MEHEKHNMNMGDHGNNDQEDDEHSMNMDEKEAGAHDMSAMKADHKGGEHATMDPGEHHKMMRDDFRKRTFVTLLVTIPVLILSPTIQGWLNFSVPSFPGDKFVLFALASFIVLWGAKPFFVQAVPELKTGNYGMMTLVSLAVASGYLYSVGATFFFEADDFYWEISTLTLFLLFGHWMEMKAVIKASSSLTELVKLIPPKANLVKGDQITEVDTAVLQIGDVVLIKPGEKIPVDGVVADGSSDVNEALITGEAKPVKKQVDDQVIGGSVNVAGSLRVRVNKVGEDTALSQIIRLVKTAQESKPRSQKLADKAAKYLTITAVVVGLATFVFWTFFTGQGVLFALTLTITVIVIACPHALGLAIPTVTTISTTLAAKNGILVRDMQGVETARTLDYVVFDKTGTLTKGKFGVSDVETTGDWDEEKLLTLTAAVERNSEHTIALGVVQHAEEQKISIPDVKGFKSVAGRGANGEVNKQIVHVGSPAYMKELKVPLNAVEEKAGELSTQGKTVIYVTDGNKLQGIIALSDIIKPESQETVQRLQQMGVKVAMLTGDHKATAAFVAGELGLDTFFAEVLPQDKVNKVKELQDTGNIVAMVGDGVNDAPALTQADVGIAIGAGTDVAQESAEIVLVKSNPLDVAKLILLSQKTMSKMKQNLVWATGYNVIAIPMAAGVLFNFGIVLKPEWGALAMASSSIIVVANALLLKKEKLV